MFVLAILTIVMSSIIFAIKLNCAIDDGVKGFVLFTALLDDILSILFCSLYLCGR